MPQETSAALTSWKEIALDLGKGVRTVQRWEQERGLPVRCDSRYGKSNLLAFREELNACMHSCFKSGDGPKSEAERLRSKIAELQAENKSLRCDCRAL